MKALPAILALLLGTAHGQEVLDRLDEKLTFDALNDQLRAHVSGLLDLEGYSFPQPPPGLIFADGYTLFNPRLSLFLDAQAGPKLYFFVQARADRGFDPADSAAEARLDEYALRFTPWEDGRFNIQAGKFATIIGNWVSRHLSWDNPFVTAPLPYENITHVSDSEIPSSVSGFIEDVAGEKYEHSPVIWGPVYSTGASAAGRIGPVELAAEVKNSGLASRPEAWSPTAGGFDDPSVSVRLGYRPGVMWNFGTSASTGPYLRDEAAGPLPPGTGIHDFRQTVVGQDASFAWHHLQLWAEVFESRFEVPNVGDADSVAYYLEGKYKLTPRLFGALRWNQQFFGTVRGPGENTPWGHDIWRADTALGFRFTAHAQFKLQYSLQREDGVPHPFGNLVAAQFTVKF